MQPNFGMHSFQSASSKLIKHLTYTDKEMRYCDCTDKTKSIFPFGKPQ